MSMQLSSPQDSLKAKATGQQNDKMKFFMKDFFSKYYQIRSFLRNLVTFTEEIPNGKLHFSLSEQVMNISQFRHEKGSR